MATTLPSVNGTAETVITAYNNVGRAVTVAGTSAPVGGTAWDSLCRDRRDIGSSNGTQP
jgi:hypothetical protein